MGEIQKSEKAAKGLGFQTYEEASEQAGRYASEAISKETKRAYSGDFKRFLDWCDKVGNRCPIPEAPVPAQWLAAYYSDMAVSGKKASSIQRAHVSISFVHKNYGWADENPCKKAEVLAVLQGIKRELQTRPHKKKALSPEQIREMLETSPGTAEGVRDKAMLILGILGGLRRSEIAALRVSDIEFTNEGVAVLIRSSKTDKLGVGHVVGLAKSDNPETCPKEILHAWIKGAARKGEMPLFCSLDRWGNIKPSTQIRGEVVAKAVKRCAARIGLDPSIYAGHSLRRGAATAAFQAEVPEKIVMEKFRWASVSQMRGYVAERDTFDQKFNLTERMGF